MTRMFKYAAAVGTAGMLAIGMSMPSYAAHGRNAAAAIGFGAGAVVGATAANAANNGYYGEPGEAYAPGYARETEYGPGYRAYAYAPGSGMRGSDQVCDRSPASLNYAPCPSH